MFSMSGSELTEREISHISLKSFFSGKPSTTRLNERKCCDWASEIKLV